MNVDMLGNEGFPLAGLKRLPAMACTQIHKHTQAHQQSHPWPEVNNGNNCHMTAVWSQPLLARERERCPTALFSAWVHQCVCACEVCTQHINEAGIKSPSSSCHLTILNLSHTHHLPSVCVLILQVYGEMQRWAVWEKMCCPCTVTDHHTVSQSVSHTEKQSAESVVEKVLVPQLKQHVKVLHQKQKIDVFTVKPKYLKSLTFRYT